MIVIEVKIDYGFAIASVEPHLTTTGVRVPRPRLTFLSQSASAALMRVRQPGPVARNAATTSLSENGDTRTGAEPASHAIRETIDDPQGVSGSRDRRGRRVAVRARRFRPR